MSERDAERVRKALAAARDRGVAARDLGAEPPPGVSGPVRGRQLPQSMRVAALIAEHLARIGLDAETMEHELAAERAESDRRLNELKADAVAQSGARAASLQRLVEAERAALGGLVATTGGATTGNGTTQYFSLDSPAVIEVTDGVVLESSTIQPYNSRAKVRRSEIDNPDGGAHLGAASCEFLHFFYLWDNPRQDVPAVVTVSAVLALNGFCSAKSRGGAVDGGSGRLIVEPTLDLLQPWTQPISTAARQSGESQTAVDITADSTGWFTDDHTAYAVEFRGFLLNYEQEFVPPGQQLLIDVALHFYDNVFNGEVSADFATGEFDVSSPFVELAILS